MARPSDPGFDRRTFAREVTLGQSACAVFREAVLRCLTAGEHDHQAAEALRQSAHAAREQRIQPEHVVALIRTPWYQAYPTLRPTVDHDLRLVHIIGTALDAYFADAESEASSLPAPRAD
jgi:hypothetical protein